MVSGSPNTAGISQSTSHSFQQHNLASVFLELRHFLHLASVNLLYLGLPRASLAAFLGHPFLAPGWNAQGMLSFYSFI